MGHHQAPREPESLLRRGLLLEYGTLSWNVVGTGLLLAAAMAAHSVALLGFGLDSLIEIGASMVVVWQLRDKGGKRRRRALQVISVSFIALAIYIGATAAYTLTHRVSPCHFRVRHGVASVNVCCDARVGRRQAPCGKEAEQSGTDNRGARHIDRRLSSGLGASGSGAQRVVWLVVGRPTCWSDYCPLRHQGRTARLA
jgi:hypothetical protein